MCDNKTAMKEARCAFMDQGKVEFTRIDNTKFSNKSKYNRKHKKNNGKRANVKEQKQLKYKLKHQFDSVPSDDEERQLKHIEARNEIIRQSLEAEFMPHGEADISNIPEMGKDIWTQLRELASFLKDIESDAADDALRHAENVLILALQMYNANSLSEMIIAATAYIKFYCKQSVVRTLTLFIHEVTKDATHEELEVQGFSAREICDCWDLLKANTAFSKISYLVNAAFSISLCSMKNLSWSIEGVQLLEEEHRSQMFKTKDIIDATISSFTWMAETGIWCFKEKSLAPILYSDQRLTKYYTECTYLFANAQKAKHGDIDINEFERRLDDTILLSSQMQKTANSPAVKEILQKKYSALVLIKEDCVAKRKNTALRFAPLGISIFGESSIGKSNITDLVMKTALTAMGFSDDPAGIITMSEATKHDDSYTNDVVGIKIDDAAQAKSQFVQESPARKYITMFNSVAAQVVKAELNDKGRVFFDFKCGIITTNVKDLDARLYSNYPVAVLRRFIHVEARVKEEYRVPGGTSLNTDHPDIVNHDNPEEILDVWEFDIEEVIPSNGKAVWKTMTIPTDNGDMYCKDLNLKYFLDAIIFLAKKHARKQAKEVVKSTAFGKMKCCDKCFRLQQYCECVPCSTLEVQGFQEQICMQLVDSAYAGLLSSVRLWVRPIYNLFTVWKPDLVNMASEELRRHIEKQCNHYLPMCVSLTPEFIHNTQTFQWFLHKWHTHFKEADMMDFQNRVKWLSIAISISFFCMGLLTFIPLIWFIYWFLCLTSSYTFKQQVIESKKVYAERRDALSEYGKSLRDGWVGKGAVALIGITAIVFLIRAWNKQRAKEMITEQAVDVLAEDAKPSWMNSIMGSMYLKLNPPPKSVTATTSQVTESLSKNLVYGTFDVNNDGKGYSCGVFFPRKSLMLFPKHIVYPNQDMTKTPTESINVTLYRHDKPGGKFEVRINLKKCYSFPNLDMLGAKVPNSPDFGTIDWFPKDLPKGSCLGKMIVPLKEKTNVVASVCPKFGNVGHHQMEFYGAEYRTPFAQNGACMAPIVNDGKNPCLLGFHIGGHSLTQQGVLQCVTSQNIEDCIEWFEEHNNGLGAKSGEMPSQQYDIDLKTSNNLHPKALYVQSLDNAAFIDLHGSSKVRTEQKSQVVESLFSKDVEAVCGVANSWGPPKLKPNWKAYNTNIGYFSDPAKMFDPVALERAQLDWEKPLMYAMDEYVLQEDFKPLDMHATICGISGKKFIDAMPMDTGMGFPIFGKKNKRDTNGESLHFDEVRDGEVLISRTPKEHVMKEYNRLLECWKRNERGYPVTTATLKDEPTLLTKDKVRVFQAAPVALGMHIRKYFLPIARFLHMHSLTAETGVGVNAFSKDWEVLNKHAKQFAYDGKMLAWDYSKYDVRMNSQLVRAAWESMIKLAERGGYSKEDLYVMKAMIVDIAHPLMDINGTLLTAYNMNTSGNNMTVDVNGIVGCFLVRMGFYDEYPNAGNFRECVAAMTYGDDFEGSCHKDYRNFNFLTYKSFLAKHGMKITLPSKTDDEVDFMHENEVDFLKRKSSHIPEIGYEIGKLDENSIFKSLHSNLKSTKATEREVAASCVDTALNEWFAYGREHYEMRRAQMQEVCRRHDLPPPSLYVTFDERVQHWKEKYDPDSL